MRYRRTDLKRRVNGTADFRFGRQEVTSHAGLELFREYLRRSGFVALLRKAVDSSFPKTDFGSVSMVLTLLGLILVGGRRVLHLRNEQGDPIMARFAGLSRLPAPRTVSYWLQSLRDEHVERLSKLNQEVVGSALARGGRRLTLDVDGSVISAGRKVQGASKGYNRQRRGAHSYYPISAYEAQEGQIVRLLNRPGNINDGAAAVTFVEDLIRQLRHTVPGRRLLELRMDGAFFREDVLQVLDDAGVEYALRAPFHPWLNLRTVAAKANSDGLWERVDDEISSHESRLDVWGRRRRVVLYRRRVSHQSRRNFQLDLFDPDDGHYEYSAILTNKRLNHRNLWHFHNGRGSHEKVYGELKGGLAFDCLPSLSEPANAAWQMLSVLAFNLSRAFQTQTSAPSRTANRKRRTLHRFETIHTLRFKLLKRAALLIRPAGKTTLHLGPSQETARHFLDVADAIRG